MRHRFVDGRNVSIDEAETAFFKTLGEREATNENIDQAFAELQESDRAAAEKLQSMYVGEGAGAALRARQADLEQDPEDARIPTFGF